MEFAFNFRALMALIKPDDLYAFFDVTTLAFGQAMYESGFVKNLEDLVEQGEGQIKATVNSRSENTYFVELSIQSSEAGVFLEGHCDCGAKDNCGHMVAVLKAFEVDYRKRRRFEVYQHEDDLIYASDRARKTQSEKSQKLSSHQISYLLHLERKNRWTSLVVEAWVSKKSEKKTELERPLQLIVSQRREMPGYLKKSDVKIIEPMQRGAKERHSYVMGSFEDYQLLRKIVATKRCFWGKCPRSPLVWGKPIEGVCSWRILDENRSEFSIRTDPEVTSLLPLAKPLYYSEQNHTIGLVKVEPKASDVAYMLSQAVYDQKEFQTVLEKLGYSSWRAAKLPSPSEVSCYSVEGVTPVPRLRLVNEHQTTNSEHWLPGRDIPRAILSFDYQGHLVDAEEPVHKSTLLQLDESEYVRVYRHHDEEQKVINRLKGTGLVLCQKRRGVLEVKSGESSSQVWSKVMLNLIDWRDLGWKVEFSDDFMFVDPQRTNWSVSGEKRADELQVRIDLRVENQSVDLIKMLSGWCGHNKQILEPLWITLEDGRQTVVSEEQLSILAALLTPIMDRSELNEEGQALVPVSMVPGLLRFQEAFSEKDPRFRSSEELKQQFENIANPIIERIEPPPGLDVSLRDYQKAGLGWLQFLRENSFGGVLADDMGLGKTLQTIAHLWMEKDAGRLNSPSLVVAPTSLLFNWRNEIERFAPGLSCVIYHGPGRKKQQKQLPLVQIDIIITSYPLLVRDKKFHLDQHYVYVVLDESQKIKNPDTVLAQTACQLSADYRICLTGTPIENHLGELWSQFDFLMPGLLGARRYFIENFQQPIEKGNNEDRKADLAAILRPFILRRTKDEVALELPARTDIVRYVQMDTAQRKLYDTVLMTVSRQVRELISQQVAEKNRMTILAALLRLRQVCCDPRLLKDRGESVREGSGKLELLLEMIPAMIEEGRQILIFSQFTSMLAIIENDLELAGIKTLKLTGGTRNREQVVDQFQQGKAPVFLVSLKAGGTGLNLTAADVVIHYDPWWNPAVEDQATDRAHRIGQTRPVFNYKLIAADTIEEKIQLLQKRKKQLADDIYQQQKSGSEIILEDLEDLLS